MAGKADLVNSIVDSVDGITRLTASVEAEEDGGWGYASLDASAPVEGTTRVGSGSGSGGGT